ncbi:hypothetical protein MRX96_049488 [Rhipicephalus microplus]
MTVAGRVESPLSPTNTKPLLGAVYFAIKWRFLPVDLATTIVAGLEARAPERWGEKRFAGQLWPHRSHGRDSVQGRGDQESLRRELREASFHFSEVAHLIRQGDLKEEGGYDDVPSFTDGSFTPCHASAGVHARKFTRLFNSSRASGVSTYNRKELNQRERVSPREFRKALQSNEHTNYYR